MYSVPSPVMAMEENGAEVFEAGMAPSTVALPKMVLSRMRPLIASSM